MRWRGVGRARCAPGGGLSQRWRAFAVALLGVAVAGCSSGVQLEQRFASATGAAAGDATVAFESIDGPPPAVFRKLVDVLNEEAGASQVPVVSRTGPATYRVRGYVSAVVEHNQTSFAWVWDIYDADKRRALRVSGREPASGSPRDVWSAADDRVLRRMARSGMDRIAAFLSAPGPARPAAPAALPRFGFASVRDDTPEAAGIVRVRNDDKPVDTASIEPPARHAPRPQ